MLLWALFDVVLYTFYIYTLLKIQLLNHSIIYKSWLYILFSSRGLGYILHKHSPQQVVYLLYTSPVHALHIICNNNNNYYYYNCTL